MELTAGKSRSRPGVSSMKHEITRGAILIKDDALLPEELYLESEPCVRDWKVVTNLNALALDREILRTGWTLFCSAGETKVSVFGIGHMKMVRRAIEVILTKKSSDGFNCLEILQTKFVGSARFPLVQHLTVSAQWRHIQQRTIRFSAGDVSNKHLQQTDIGSKAAAPASDRTFQHLVP
jgi:hypothetical protein